MPISIKTIDDVKNKSYSIYLRGFSMDNYRNPWYETILPAVVPAVKRGNLFSLILNSKQSVFSKMGDEEEYAFYKDEWGISHFIEKPFDEICFVKIFRKKLHETIYTVGMTKELVSPVGAKRIYLDDTTWQADVVNLINRADYVFVLVNPSESCIWEILQCQINAAEKTYYFIHSIDDLKTLIDNMGDKAPAFFKKCLEDGQIKNHSIICNQNNVLYYKNTKKGFKELSKELFPVGTKSN